MNAVFLSKMRMRKYFSVLRHTFFALYDVFYLGEVMIKLFYAKEKQSIVN